MQSAHFPTQWFGKYALFLHDAVFYFLFRNFLCPFPLLSAPRQPAQLLQEPQSPEQKELPFFTSFTICQMAATTTTATAAAIRIVGKFIILGRTSSSFFHDTKAQIFLCKASTERIFSVSSL